MIFARAARAALALAAIAGCGRADGADGRLPSTTAGPETAPPVASAAPSGAASPPPSVTSSTDGAPWLVSAPLSEIEPSREPGAPASALAGGRRVALTLATKSDPEGWREAVAFYRLSRALGLDVVPPVERRAIALAALLDGAASDLARKVLAASIVVRADGKVDAAVAELPPVPTAERATAWSYEEAAWRRAVEFDEPLSAEQLAAAEGYVTLRVLDFLAGNVFRARVAEDASGRLWLVDNRGAFRGRPEPTATAEQLERLKKVARFPRRLSDRLARFDDRAAREALTPGAFDGWLVPPRTALDATVRARTVRSLIEARRMERGDAAFLPPAP